VQLSMVFNQIAWPGVGKGDYDDCWVLSSIQCVHAVAPWLRLPSSRAFRKAAGDPDDGYRDGGTLGEIVKGVETMWPRYFNGHLTQRRGASWQTFVEDVELERPVSVATISAKLPTRLQFGFGGYHQISVAKNAKGDWLVANPLAPVYSRWVKVQPAEMKAAVMSYGRDKDGRSGAWYVVFPDAEQLAELYWGQEDETPFDQEDIDAATAALRERIDEARDVLDGAQP
jgi:hypothetical protein